MSEKGDTLISRRAPVLFAERIKKKNKCVPFFTTSLSGGHSEWEPPDSIPNSEVKTLCADDSLGFPHAKVGHCQAFIQNPRYARVLGVFLCTIGFR